MQSSRIVGMIEVTEAAALSAGKWIGKGEKNDADQAAVEAMREKLGHMDISGTVVIGEGERDEAPMLFIGEEVGAGGEKIDIAVDPLEGTNLTAFHLPNSLSVMAFAPSGTLLHAPDTYMDKIATGSDAAGAVHIDASPSENVRNVAKALGKPVEEVVVCILDRDRHKDLITEVRQAGARIRMISDGDIFGATATAIRGTGIDLYLGIGAAPEGVLACAAMRCVGGCFMGRFAFRNDEERERAARMSDIDLDGVLTMDHLVGTDEAVFIASGVTDGEMLRGVRYYPGASRVNSVSMDGKTGTVRFTDTIYRSGNETISISA